MWVFLQSGGPFQVGVLLVSLEIPKGVPYFGNPGIPHMGMHFNWRPFDTSAPGPVERRICRRRRKKGNALLRSCLRERLLLKGCTGRFVVVCSFGWNQFLFGRSQQEEHVGDKHNTVCKQLLRFTGRHDEATRGSAHAWPCS